MQKKQYLSIYFNNDSCESYEVLITEIKRSSEKEKKGFQKDVEKYFERHLIYVRKISP